MLMHKHQRGVGGIVIAVITEGGAILKWLGTLAIKRIIIVEEFRYFTKSVPSTSW